MPQYKTQLQPEGTATASWRTGICNLSLKFLVINLFDTDPPFTNRSAGPGFGYDERRMTSPVATTSRTLARVTA